MKLARNSSVDVTLTERITKSLSFSSKGKEIIERTEDIINEEDLDKLLERKKII